MNALFHNLSGVTHNTMRALATKAEGADLVAVQAEVDALEAGLASEIADRIADVNAEEAARIADVNAEEARAIAAEGAFAADLAAHEADTFNPHAVTKAQVGLSNVDNTSDANKPVSTAQQTALDLKLDIADYHQHVYYPEDFSLPTNGTTECAAAFNAMIAALADGETFDGVGFTFKVDSTITVAVGQKNITLQNFTLDGDGVSNTGNIFAPSGTIGGALAISGALAAGETTIPVSSTATLAAENLIWIGSTDFWDTTDDLTLQGEYHRVKSVTDGAHFEIYSGLLYPIDNASVYKITPVENLTLRRVEVLGNGQGATGGQTGIYASYCSDLVMEYCEVGLADDAAVRLDRCWNTSVWGGRYGRANRTGTSYGIQLVNGSYHTSITGAAFEDARHGVDHGDTDGPNRFTTVDNCKFYYMREMALSTHTAADYTIYSNNTIWCDPANVNSGGCLIRSSNAVVEGNTIHNAGGPALAAYLIVDAIAGWSVKFNGNKVNSCVGDLGVWIYGQATPADVTVEVTGNILKAGASGGRLIGIYAELDTAGLATLRADGNTVEGFERGIMVDAQNTTAVKTVMANFNILKVTQDEGIYLFANTDGNIGTESCVVSSNAVSGTFTYGLRGSGEENLAAHGNKFRGASTAAVSITATNNSLANLT